MAGFSFGTPTTSAFSLGSNAPTSAATSGFNFNSSTSGSSAPPVQFNVPASTQGGLSFSSPATTTNAGFSFGSTGGLSMGTPAAPQPSLSFKPGGLGGGSMFGSSTPTQQSALSFGTATSAGLTFGSTSAPAQPTLPTFGSTPATAQTLSFGAPPTTQPTLSFGNTPATSQPTLSFGSTPATSQPALSFGSIPATSQPTLSFGSTPATSQPTLSFGSTPAMSQPTLSFGSTPATSQPTLSFGSTPATSQPTLSFGSTTGTTQPALSFGATAPTSQPPLSFGTIAQTPSTQAGISFGTSTTTQPTLGFGLTSATTTASTGFSLGTPASTASGLTFGVKPAATTATSTPSLLNFSAPKTTATTGFSLSVSGAGTGTGSLFSAPTTSALATTTTAPAPFKGLGGIDTSTTQGSGQKDAKSAKENVVNPEIMQTLDSFKNFVKQQKTLSCEVSRAPVKPMHKVTEDADGLKNLLTSVSSALQKNRFVANKLKVDTTKCLSLCEMAQATHDTPPGLQNDNIAPLEFFIQLVSKFERDIQLLRQEIDNTEKHVNSLSYPAILTPQELSVALRRLHDSFVALAGRLQTAHAGVIAQKERHLSLRRHFLKDHTNIFEAVTRISASTRKPQCKPNLLPMPGPTPFSSLGGLPNLNLITGQDKASTFSTGNTALSGWGSSAMSSLGTNSAALLQSPGSCLLSSPQPVDNQSFQLGKPPPGNKRGKR